MKYSSHDRCFYRIEKSFLLDAFVLLLKLALITLTMQIETTKAIALNYDCIFPVTIFAGAVLTQPRLLLCENHSSLLLSRVLLGKSIDFLVRISASEEWSVSCQIAATQPS